MKGVHARRRDLAEGLPGTVGGAGAEGVDDEGPAGAPRVVPGRAEAVRDPHEEAAVREAEPGAAGELVPWGDEALARPAPRARGRAAELLVSVRGDDER